MWNAFELDAERVKSKTPEGLMKVSDPIYDEYKEIRREYTPDEMDKGLHLKRDYYN